MRFNSKVVSSILLMLLLIFSLTHVINNRSDALSYIYPSDSYMITIDMNKLKLIEEYGGSLTGSLIQIEDIDDINGLTITGASWSIDYVGQEFRVPGVGDKALKLSIPSGGVAYLTYTLPSELVQEVIAGSPVESSVNILPLEGDFEASISIIYSSDGGGGGCPLFTMHADTGTGELVLTGSGVQLVNASVYKILVEESSGVSRIDSLAFYSLEVPKGYITAYTQDGVALVNAEGITYPDLGPANITLSPSRFLYPLFSGDDVRITINDNLESGYLAVKVSDPWGKSVMLKELSAARLPLVKGMLKVVVEDKHYTIGPKLPLEGLYLFPLSSIKGRVTVSISNIGPHPVAIDYIGLVGGENVRHINIDNLPRVPMNPSSTDISGTLIKQGSRIQISLGDYEGLLVVKYDIKPVEQPNLVVSSSPGINLNPSIGGWVRYTTGVVDVSGDASTLDILIMISSDSGATVMVDNIEMGYMAEVIIGSGIFEDPDDTWCPVSLPGIDCIDFYYAYIEYTYLLTYKITEVNLVNMQYFVYGVTADLGYVILAEGYAHNMDDGFDENDYPIVGLGIGVNTTSTGTHPINDIAFDPSSTYVSNDRNVTGEPPPSIENNLAWYSYLSLAASGLSLLLGTTSIVLLETPLGVALAVASAATGSFSFILGVADYLAPEPTDKDTYIIYVQVDYDGYDGVSNATMGFKAIDLFKNAPYETESNTHIYYYMPPGPTYPSNNIIKITASIRS
ncbi:MAG: hypothetical protein GSR85_00195 [Desulfurococcales archaeon]|nr:hypothetical protein [Desulfurococcales archaeon]